MMCVSEPLRESDSGTGFGGGWQKCHELVQRGVCPRIAGDAECGQV